MALSCSKKTISIIKRMKNQWWFYCLNCLRFLRAKNKLELHKRVCGNKEFCHVVTPFEDTKILEFNRYQKPDKTPFTIYAIYAFMHLIEKKDGCKNNHANPSTTKVIEHIPSGLWISTMSLFKSMENKHDLYGSKCWMKRFWKSLRKHAVKIIIFKKKTNKTINKRAAGIIWQCINLSCLWEKFENKYL